MRVGYLAASAAALLWAAGATVAARLFERGASPLELTAARAWIGVLGLVVIVLAVRLRRARIGLARSVPAPLGMRISFGLVIAAVTMLYYTAISRLPVAVAIIVQYTAPGLVVLWSAAVERRRPTRRVLGALALAFAGVALLAGIQDLIRRGAISLDPLGLGAAAGSAIAFAAYMLIGERLGRRIGPHGTLLWGFAVASILWIGVLGGRGRPDTLLDPSFTAGILFVAVGATIAPFLLFLWGIGRVGAARAGIVSSLEPVAAAAFAFLWLGQTLGSWEIAGGAMVIAGIAVVQSERPPPPDVLIETAAVE